MTNRRSRGASPRTKGPIAPVTVTKVHLGIPDLAASLRRDAVERVGEANLHRVRVLHPGAYEVVLPAADRR